MLDLKNRDISEIMDLCTPPDSPDHIISRLSWSSMSEEWKEYLSENGRGHFLADDAGEGIDSDLLELRNLLLSFGGESVCLPAVEEDLYKILERGVLWDGSHAEMIIGNPSQCHANSANLWENNSEQTVIATGYALSDDGMWRQHSWLFAFDEDSWDVYIVETTSPRVAYFGFAMTYGQLPTAWANGPEAGAWEGGNFMKSPD